MIVKTKSIYDPAERGDGVRILISRYYPRGVKRNKFNIWIRGASPRIDLLKEYKKGTIDWKEFSKRFRSQLSKWPESVEAMKELRNIASENRSMTLLCYEREGQNCHRDIVKAKLDRSFPKK